MSFTPPNNRQEMQNRKILEELQHQKKVLQSKQGGTPVCSVPTTMAVPPVVHALPIEPHILSSSQRTALQHAHAHSVGHFITQDSSFGNLILPVIPRLESK